MDSQSITTATNTAQVNDLSPSKRGFPFLKLPAELRVAVYKYTETTFEKVNQAEATTDAEAEDAKDDEEDYLVGLNCYCVRMMAPQLRGICTEIKEEVEGEMAKMTTLMFDETDPNFFVTTCPRHIPKIIVQFANRIELKLSAWCFKNVGAYHGASAGCTSNCHAVHDIKSHQGYADQLLDHFSNVTSCDVQLTIAVPRGDHATWPSIKHAPEIRGAVEDWLDLEALTALRVHKDDGLRNTLWLSWTEKDEWVVPKNEEAGEKSA